MVTWDFSNKVAFVTGGTAGIDLATARVFAKAGARVVLAARGEDAGRAICAELERSGASALFVRTDVRDAASIAASVEHAASHFGPLDFAFNCAGSGGDMAPLEASPYELSNWVPQLRVRRGPRFAPCRIAIESDSVSMRQASSTRF